MKLRTKLFLPLFLIGLLFAGYTHLIWLPELPRTVEENARQDLEAHLRSVAEGLVPLVLENQLANIYDNLDAVLENNPNWVEIRLHNASGSLLYPLEITAAPPSGPGIRILTQSVGFMEPSLGSLQLSVDITPHLARAYGIRQEFHWASIVLLLMLLVMSMSMMEHLVRRPLALLAKASDHMSRGDFSFPLPKHHNDELGDLARNFARMREAIQAFQNELKGEIINHKTTAKALSREKERATHQATHDDLTGLPNRRALLQRLSYLLAGIQDTSRRHALIYIDLDQFKVVNDTVGHIAGDALLRQVSSILQRHVRQHDTLARTGGDEFIALLEYCSLTDAAQIAETMRQLIYEFRFDWGGKIFSVGMSAGIVAIDAGSGDANTILSAADAACYVAKSKGRNNIQIYQQGDSELARQHGEMNWVSRINHGLEHERFILYCQPISPLRSEVPSHPYYEVLVRLKDAEEKIILPGAFIPPAERYGLIHRLDHYVVTRALQALAIMDTEPGQLKLAVNLSGASLENESLIGEIENWAIQHPDLAHCICLEITETAAIQNLSAAVGTIHRLQKHGCRFALDDFGSGLSSFSYLKGLPVDLVKIDGSFVRDIASDSVSLAMVQSLVSIAQAMGKTVVAEYVESEKILEQLREMNVDYAQGFHIRTPFPLEELTLSAE